MFRFYKMIGGTKFYSDEAGVLLKNEAGAFMEVPATDTNAVEVADKAVSEVEKMLGDAVAEVKTSADARLKETVANATEAVNGMVDSIAKAAQRNTVSIKATEAKPSFDLESVEKGITELAGGNRKSFTFEIANKSELDFLTKTVSVGGSLTGDVIAPQRLPELTRDPVRSPFIEQISNLIPNMVSNTLSYVEVTDESGAPLRTDELAAVPEKDFEFTQFETSLKDIGVQNKHSMNLLDDAPQLVSAIKGWLQEDVNIETDAQLLNGTGTGGNLAGVFSVATILDATAVGTKRVADANLYDVVRVALTKIAVAGKGKFVGGYALLNPDDADALDLTKDANGQYVLPPFRSADGTTIKGARVIENIGVPAGKFLVGDFRKLTIGTKGGVKISMTDSDGTDFGKGILTVKLMRRVASFVRQNDSGAFQTGDIAGVITALTA